MDACFLVSIYMLKLAAVTLEIDRRNGEGSYLPIMTSWAQTADANDLCSSVHPVPVSFTNSVLYGNGTCRRQKKHGRPAPSMPG